MAQLHFIYHPTRVTRLGPPATSQAHRLHAWLGSHVRIIGHCATGTQGGVRRPRVGWSALTLQPATGATTQSREGFPTAFSCAVVFASPIEALFPLFLSPVPKQQPHMQMCTGLVQSYSVPYIYLHNSLLPFHTTTSASTILRILSQCINP